MTFDEVILPTGIKSDPTFDEVILPVAKPGITPTAAELSTLEAPEGSPQREDINRSVAGNIFAPPGAFARDPTLSELINQSMPRGVQEAQRDEQRIPLAPPLPEQGRFEQGGVLGVLDPALEAGESVARGLAPRTDTWGHLATDLGGFATPAVGSVQELMDAPENARKDYANARAQMSGASLHELPFPERLDPVTAAQQMPEGPEKQQALLNAGSNVLAQMIMAKGITHGIARPEPSHLRTEPLVPEPPPTVSTGPGTIAGDVSRALERRFQMVSEARPEMAPAPTIEETLAKTEQPPVEPAPTTADITRQILDERKQKLARAAVIRPLAENARQLIPGGEPGLERELADIDAWLKDPVKNPVVHAPPETGRTGVAAETARVGGVEVPVRQGEFAKPGYTAVETPPAPEITIPEADKPYAGVQPQPESPPVQTELPESGFSTERAQKIYGDDAVLITKGKSPEAWKAIGQADKRNPYDVLEKARARKIATPDEAANLRAEHQRLLQRARQQYGTPEYNDLAQNAVDFFNATKEVVHGPASDIFRGLQEADRPTYMSPADYDNILRERQMQATPNETATFQKVADEVRNGDRQARESAANGQDAIRKYRPNEVIPFDEAADFVKKQIKDLTEPCAL